MQYTTKEKLKTYLTGIDTVADSILEDLIKRVSKQFDMYLGRTLEKKTYREYFELRDDKIIIIDKGPLISIEKLKLTDENGENIEYKRFDSNIIYLKEEISGDVYIEYTGGYEVYIDGVDTEGNPIILLNLDEIADIEQACLEVCNDLWNNTPASGNEANIKSKQIETLSKTYFSKNEMAGGNNISYKETLDKYISLNPLYC